MGLILESWIMDLTSTVLVVGALLYYYLTSTYSFFKSKNIPYIEPDLLFGTMKDIITFKKSQAEKFDEFYYYFRGNGYSYGGIFELRKPVLFLCAPEIIKDVIVKNFPSFHDRGMSYDEHNDPLTAHLILLDGQRWKYLRSKLAPAFTTGRLKTMIKSFEEAAVPYVNIWKDAYRKNEILNVREIMAQYTTDVIGLVAFGLKLNSTGPHSYFRAMGRKIFQPSKIEKILQIVRNVYPKAYKLFRLRQYSKEMTDYFINVLRETMEFRKKSEVQSNDFLNFLMQIKETKGTNLKELDEMKGVNDYNLSVEENALELTEGVIAAQAFIFFLAGFETTSTTLSFCLYELAENPEIQKKIQDEIDDKLKEHNEINYEFLQDLTYMEQVIDESLRKYPPAPLILRVCSKPYKLPDSDAVIPKGTQIFIPVYNIHHDPEYFQEPDKFDPERFSHENREKIVPFSFLPFGDGPRVCIGKRFAMLEMKTMLATLLTKFSVIKCEKTKPIKIDPRSFILTPIDGIWLKTSARTSLES